MSHLNLLPVAVRRRHAMRKLLRMWGGGASVAIVAALAIAMYQWQRAAKLERRQTELQTSYDATHQKLQSVQRLRREIERIEGRQGVALSLVSERSVVALLGQFAAAAQSNSGMVAVERFTLHAGAPAAAQGAAGSAAPTSHVELRGVASDNVALAEFVAAIRAWELFDDVDLTSSGATQIGEKPARGYAIRCAY